MTGTRPTTWHDPPFAEARGTGSLCKNSDQIRPPSQIVPIVVFLSLGAFGAVVLGLYWQMTSQKHVEHPRDAVRRLEANLELYRLDVGHFPTSDEGGLSALLGRPIHLDLEQGWRWRGPYCKTISIDPWGHSYRYATDGDEFRVWSLGPDGVDDTGDEISSFNSTRPSPREINSPRDPVEKESESSKQP